MANKKRLDLIDREKVYENACAGCTRHGEKPGECYHDEPCERLIFAFTVAESVDAVEVVHAHWNDDGRCTNCDWYMPFDCNGNAVESDYCPVCGAKMDEERREGE